MGNVNDRARKAVSPAQDDPVESTELLDDVEALTPQGSEVSTIPNNEVENVTQSEGVLLHESNEPECDTAEVSETGTPFVSPMDSSDAFISSPNETLSPPLRHAVPLPLRHSSDSVANIAQLVLGSDRQGVDTSMDMTYTRISELKDFSALLDSPQEPLDDIPAQTHANFCLDSNSLSLENAPDTFLANAHTSTTSDSFRIPLVATYAEATNLAARFPELASEILFHPLSTVAKLDKVSEQPYEEAGIITRDELSATSAHRRRSGRVGKATQMSAEAGIQHTAESPNWAIAPRPLPSKRTRNEKPDTSERKDHRRARGSHTRGAESSSRRHSTTSADARAPPEKQEKHSRRRGRRHQDRRRFPRGSDIKNDASPPEHSAELNVQLSPSFPQDAGSTTGGASASAAQSEDLVVISFRQFEETGKDSSQSGKKDEDEALAALFSTKLNTQSLVQMQPQLQKFSRDEHKPTVPGTHLSARSKADIASWLATSSSPAKSSQTPAFSFHAPGQNDSNAAPKTKQVALTPPANRRALLEQERGPSESLAIFDSIMQPISTVNHSPFRRSGESDIFSSGRKDFLLRDIYPRADNQEATVFQGVSPLLQKSGAGLRSDKRTSQKPLFNFDSLMMQSAPSGQVRPPSKDQRPQISDMRFGMPRHSPFDPARPGSQLVFNFVKPATVSPQPDTLPFSPSLQPESERELATAREYSRHSRLVPESDNGWV